MKNCFLIAVGAFVLFAAQPIHAQGGFADASGKDARARGGFVDDVTATPLSVEEAKRLRDDAPVQLQGKIVRRMGDEKYLFRDASGELTVEIDDDVWRGLTVGPEDTVMLFGKVDKDFLERSLEVEVYSVRKP
ncbi:MAG: NirD/YgiW/YdeI family stress tolerance protein [Candidatus Accumulibacter sp.]|jgi:uncharacterized protein (TIGR00156 family)|nr:NirD/YgiW/YdeI family stress tolerance protein [Accumulibacter sp.]